MIGAKIAGRRARIAFFHDIIMAAVSFPLAMFLRIGSDLVYYEPRPILIGAVLFTVIAATVFWSMRLYEGIWRYASLNDLIGITRAATIVILIFLPAMFLIDRLAFVPRSMMVINWLVLMGLLGGPRFIYRLFKDRRDFKPNSGATPNRVPVLVVGASDAAELFIRAIRRNRNSPYVAVGIVDEKGSRVGRNIHGVHVLGDLNGIPLIIERLARDGNRPQRLVLTKDNYDGATVRQLFEIAEQNGATLARLPQLTDFKAGMGDDGVDVHPVAIEDLLGRAQTVLDRASMKALVHGKRVVVTGAGGTIGGELVRQVAAYEPARLCLIDNSEYHLYEIDLQVSERHADLDRRAVLADVRDSVRVEAIFTEEAPDLVFHAAALKHVPMVERHPDEGVLTNVIGTRNVANACRRNDVAAMVLISTDKAVNPTSFMGATKRLAETYCQALDIVQSAAGRGTRYITVRFGNVLGSTGSVVPLFQRQLARGGPLTVTHPDMTRYFMTVREAVELVLQASALGTREAGEEGKIYVLDMGEPVRIIDLAKQMILLAGLQPEKDIRIEITGPRSGEKLAEEVLHDSEPPVPTQYSGILLAAPRAADHALLDRSIDELEDAARARRIDETSAIVRRIVPEYRPDEDIAAVAAVTR